MQKDDIVKIECRATLYLMQIWPISQKKSENFCGGLIPLFLTLGIIFGMPWHYYRRYRRKKDISLKAMFQPDTEEDPERKRLGGKQIEGYKADRFRY